MARVTHVKAAKQRYAMLPVLNDEGKPTYRTIARTTKTGRQIHVAITVEDRSKPLPPHTCESCRKPIEVGTPYKWVQPKSGPYGGIKRFRHESCPDWRQSELSSAKTAPLMSAIEDFESSLPDAEDYSDIENLLTDVANVAREIAEEYTQSADNMEDGFGHETEMSNQLRERADELESFADEVEQAISSEEQEFEEPIKDESISDEEHEAALATGREEWLENLRSLASDAVGNAPL